MKLVCECTGDENVGDYNYAVIELPEGYADWLVDALETAAKIAKREPEFYGIEYFDYQVHYYRAIDIGQEIDARMFYPVPEEFEPQEEALRTAAKTVIVQESGVMWRGSPKHSNGEFETPLLSAKRIHDIKDRTVLATPIPDGN